MPETKPPRTLRAIVLDLIGSTDLADPREIAAAVLQQSTRAEREAFLRDTLTTGVRLILGEHRKSLIVPAQRPTWESAESTTRQRPTPSAKVAAIRDAWQGALAGRYSVGGTWKVLAEFTADDALAVAAERRQQSADALAWAERFEALARAIKDAGAAVAADLAAAPAGWLS